MLLATFSIFCNVLLVFFLGWLGSLFYRGRKIEKEGKFIIWTVTGLLLIVTVMAVIFTRGRTVFLFALLPLVYYRITLPQSDATQKEDQYFRVIRRYILPFLLLSILFSLRAWILFDYQSVIPDNVYYSRVADALVHTGYENEYHYYIRYSELHQGMSPYHYFELWLNGAMSFLPLYSASAIYALLFGVVPVFGIIAVAGLAAILERGVGRSWITWVVAVLILQTSLFLLPFLPENKLAQYAYVYSSPLAMNEAKFMSPLIIGLLIYHSCKGRDYFILPVMLVLLVIINYGFLPAVCGVIFLLALYFLITGHRAVRMNWIKTTAISLIIIGAVFLMYQSPLATKIARAGLKLSETELLASEQTGIIVKMKVFAGALVSLFAYWMVPLMIVAITIYKRAQKIQGSLHKDEYSYGMLFLFMSVCGALAWALLNHLLNSVQLFSMVQPLGLIFLSALFAFLWVEIRQTVFGKINIAVLSLFLLAGNFLTLSRLATHRSEFQEAAPDALFVEKVTDAILSNGSYLVGYFPSDGIMTDPFACYSHFSNPFNEIARSSSKVVFVNLRELEPVVADNALSAEHRKTGLQLGLLYNYALSSDGHVVGADSVVWEFVRNAGIKYIFVSSAYDFARTGDHLEVLYEDKKSGQFFCRLKNG